jgi:hypothetical protein
VLSGRARLAAVTVSGLGVIAHWSPAAGRLFGLTRQEAIGRPAAAVLPVSGVIDTVGDGEAAGAAYAQFTDLPGTGQPTSGRFWGAGAGDGPHDVLWWACPLVGPGLLRLLVLATDGTRLEQDCGGERISAGFARHSELPRAGERAGQLRQLLTGMDDTERADIVDQLLEQGCPVLETSTGRRLPVLPRLPGAALPPTGTKA